MAAAAGGVGGAHDLNATEKFCVFDPRGARAHHVSQHVAHERQRQGRERDNKERLNAEHGARMEAAAAGRIGGPFQPLEKGSPPPEFVAYRVEVFERLWKAQQERNEAAPARGDPILVDVVSPVRPEAAADADDSKEDSSANVGGNTAAAPREVSHVEAEALVTTPLKILVDSFPQSVVNSIVVAKVRYSSRVDQSEQVVAADDEDDMAGSATGRSGHGAAEGKAGEQDAAELWDLSRPLVGDCSLEFCSFDTPEGKTVYWHSSAHILGAALEAVFGCHLTIGPPLQQGFYYDAYMGEELSVGDSHYKPIVAAAKKVIKKKHQFQRLVLSKEEALEMFAQNPFKRSLITNKVPDGAKTTVYRCGPLIDLCMGPHLPHTGKVGAFAVVKNSGTNWLGNVNNDPLQRVYAISFPSKEQLTAWQEHQAMIRERDHRRIGLEQELVMFNELSAGSAFWLPHGTRVYNKLTEFIRSMYRQRGFHEVITPNMYNTDLWKTSGHYAHYKDNMFCTDVEGQEYGMKPMNCPGHCLMFRHRARSYRELPLRLADFGVLHRNEVSGALSGLTRVRRFQQDDAHIFCRPDQIKEEILGALDFMNAVYRVLGLRYILHLSTRPEKALGDEETWASAEQALTEALNEYVGEGNWELNPGDGAFYGPKIDIQVHDAMERVHQCATVQLDFQMPERFELKFVTGEESQERPVMIHRAIYGSFERMIAILIENTNGKWPFWLSPRQGLVVPVAGAHLDYAYEVQRDLHSAGFYVDVEDSHKTLNKKIREGQLAQYNFILVTGDREQEHKTVNIRTRENEVTGEMSISDCIEFFRGLEARHE